MNLGGLARLAGLIGLAGTLVACGGGEAPRDVLIITLDTTRADHIGWSGAATAATPHLDAVAMESTVFDEAMATVPVTLPSHASIFTGLYPFRNGVRYNGSYVLAPEQVTLAEHLRDAGFATAAVVSGFPLAARFGTDQGFDTYDDTLDAPTGGPGAEWDERLAKDAVDRAVAWWSDKRGGPRFLWVHVFDPHWLYRPPFPFSAEFRDAPYAGEIAYVDREIGRLVEHLREHDEWDSTLVVIAGDHGEGLYEHNERWHASLVYQSVLRVPLVVKQAGGRGADRVAQPVSLVDITPTVLDAAGLDVPDDLDGISLLPAIRSGEAPIRTLYYESLTDNINFGWSALIGIRRGDWKYFEGGRAEMYDLGSDPGETENLAELDPERAADLAAELAPFREEVGQSDSGDAAMVDQETLDKLASLGYVGGSSERVEIAVGGVHPPDMTDIQQELLRAQTAVASGAWEPASEILDYVLTRDPTNLYAMHFRSIVFLREERFEEARKLAEAMVEVHGDLAVSHDLLGQVLAAAGEPARSAEVYRGVLESHPERTDLRYRYFLALVESGDLAAAGVEASTLERRRPTHHSTWVASAILAAREGRTSDAVEGLDRAVEAGLTDLTAVEASPWFEAVRRDPRYPAIRERAENQAKSNNG